MKRFWATNEPGTCLWCGDRLGQNGRSKYFCTLRCGYMFANAAANTSFTFQPKREPKPKPPKREPCSPRCPKCKRAMEHIELAYESRWYCRNTACTPSSDRIFFEWTDKTDRDALTQAKP